MRLIAPFVQLVTQRSLLEVWCGCGWVAALTALEIAGRRFTSDIMDVAGLLVVGLLMWLTRVVHRNRPLTAVTFVSKAMRTLLSPFWQSSVDVGVDLVKLPPLPRGIPANWKASVVWLMLIVGCLLASAPVFPSKARNFLSGHFYLLLLAIEGVLWMLLSVGIAAYLFAMWARIHDELVERHRGQKRRSIQGEVQATLVAFGIVLCCGAVCPFWLPLAVHALLFVASSAALLASSSGLELIWRSRSDGQNRAFDARWLRWITTAGAILLNMAAILITGGEFLGDMRDFPYLGTAQVTVFLGRMFAWTALAGTIVVTYYDLRFAAMGILFHQDGFWPFGKQPQVSEDRRCEIQCRREIVRRLQMLFRRARRQAGVRGSGLWIAVQHWFVLGLSRDTSQVEPFDRETTIFDDIIGPPYHRVFTSNSRRRFQRIADALQVDLIYVESGVSFQRLVRVLRMMFEIYDVYGGRRRAEEMHFAGLPGVRVLIHQFDQCHAPRHGRAHYPEPDYDDLGRARILHVFKDRGESVVDAPIPASWEGTPVASGV